MSWKEAELILLVACAIHWGVSGAPPQFSYSWSEVNDQGCNPPIKPDISCMCWLFEAPGEPNYSEWFCNHQYPNGRPRQSAGNTPVSQGSGFLGGLMMPPPFNQGREMNQGQQSQGQQSQGQQLSQGRPTQQ
ncbi:hypothetical protein GE061_007683 [Apolygus lucorum]|uniref:Thyroglobulin type-1 domain-containing protein n=1 Tax=Apolygus lucorum TaxID=248454 RepID=A0A6A4ITN8_APOLU|nr:hypothetical protein GE061_007683 [Apolygus lucorum]